MSPGTPSHGPQAAYQRALREGYSHEPAQAATVAVFEQLYQRLIHAPRRRWLPWARRAPAVTGLYLWGGVGRGKTWLMDLFFDCLDGPPKQRTHFHRFMQRIHAELRAEGKARDPLPRPATIPPSPLRRTPHRTPHRTTYRRRAPAARPWRPRKRQCRSAAPRSRPASPI